MEEIPFALRVKPTESVTLTRGMKGQYAWEIKLRSEYLGEGCLQRLKRLDQWMREKFSEEAKEEA